MRNFLKAWRKIVEPPAEQEFAPVLTEDVLILGHYADEALKNPAFNAAFNKIELDIINAWKTSSPKDGEAREHLYYRMEGLAYIKTKLQGMINNMKIEIKNRERQADQKAAPKETS